MCSPSSIYGFCLYLCVLLLLLFTVSDYTFVFFSFDLRLLIIPLCSSPSIYGFCLYLCVLLLRFTVSVYTFVFSLLLLFTVSDYTFVFFSFDLRFLFIPLCSSPSIYGFCLYLCVLSPSAIYGFYLYLCVLLLRFTASDYTFVFFSFCYLRFLIIPLCSSPSIYGF